MSCTIRDQRERTEGSCTFTFCRREPRTIDQEPTHRNYVRSGMCVILLCLLSRLYFLIIFFESLRKKKLELTVLDFEYCLEGLLRTRHSKLTKLREKESAGKKKKKKGIIAQWKGKRK